MTSKMLFEQFIYYFFFCGVSKKKKYFFVKNISEKDIEKRELVQ